MQAPRRPTTQKPISHSRRNVTMCEINIWILWKLRRQCRHVIGMCVAWRGVRSSHAVVVSAVLGHIAELIVIIWRLLLIIFLYGLRLQKSIKKPCILSGCWSQRYCASHTRRHRPTAPRLLLLLLLLPMLSFRGIQNGAHNTRKIPRCSAGCARWLFFLTLK